MLISKRCWLNIRLIRARRFVVDFVAWKRRLTIDRMSLVAIEVYEVFPGVFREESVGASPPEVAVCHGGFPVNPGFCREFMMCFERYVAEGRGIYDPVIYGGRHLAVRVKSWLTVQDSSGRKSIAELGEL